MPKHKPATDAPELSPTAIAILEAAAAREDGALRPVPVRMPPAAERAVLAKLREAGLTETAQLEGGPLERIAERGRTRLAMRALRAALEAQPSGGAHEAVSDDEAGAGRAVPSVAATGHDSGTGAPPAGEEDEAFEPPAFLRRDGGRGAADLPEAMQAAAPGGQQVRSQRQRGKAGPAVARQRADAAAARAERTAQRPIRQAGEGAPARQTKGARLIELLRRPGGASIDEITGELGWLAHTARARIAVDVRGRGHAVATERVERGGRRVTVYRVGPADPA